LVHEKERIRRHNNQSHWQTAKKPTKKLQPKRPRKRKRLRGKQEMHNSVQRNANRNIRHPNEVSKPEMAKTILPTIRQTTKDSHRGKDKHANIKRKTKNGTIPVNVKRLRHKTNRTNMATSQRHKPRQRNRKHNKRKTLRRQSLKTQDKHARNAEAIHKQETAKPRQQNIPDRIRKHKRIIPQTKKRTSQKTPRPNNPANQTIRL